MGVEETSKTGPKRKTKTRILKLVSVLIVVVILLVVFAVPGFMSSESGRKIILAKINSAIRGKTDFTRFSMGWLAGIKVTDFSYNDDAGQTSVQVKQITTKPHYGAILIGNLSFGQTIIDNPNIKINLKAPQITEAPQQRIPSDEETRVVLPPIEKIDLIVNGGNVKVTDRKARVVELAQIKSKVNLRPRGQRTNFDMNLAVVGKDRQSQVHTAGYIKPKRTKTGWSLKGTSGELVVEVNDLELGSLEPIFALSGIEVQAKGRVSGNIESEIKDGRFEGLSAEVKGRDLDVNAVKLIGDRFKTSSLGVNVRLARAKQMINIESFDIETDWLKAEGSGTVPTTFGSLAEFLRTDSSLSGRFELDVAQISTQMSGTFKLKEGMKVTSGMLKGEVETLTEDGKRKVKGQANLEQLEGMVAGKIIALSEPVRAKVEIASDKGGIKFDKLDLSSAFARINCTGTTEILDFKADIDLKKFQSELGQFADLGPYKIAGNLSGKGQLSVKEDRFKAVGLSSAKDVVIASADAIASEQVANIDFSFEIDRENNLIIIDSVKTNATLGQVTVKDAVIPLNDKAAKSTNLSVSASNVDLKKLQPFAVLFASFPKQMQLSGIARSDVSINSQKDICVVKTDLTKIKNLKVSYPDQKPFESNEVSLVFDAELNKQKKTVNIKKLQLESPQIRIRKGVVEHIVKADKTTLKGQFDCEFDWAAVSTIAAPFLPRGLKLKGTNKLPIDFFSEYPSGQKGKILENLSTNGKLGFEEADYMGLRFGPSEAQVRVQSGYLVIAPFSSTVNGGQFSFAGEANFKQKPTLLTTAEPMQIMKDIQINDETANKLLMYVNPIFANTIGASGIANFGCERLAIPLAGSQKNDLEVLGTISIEKLRLQVKGLLGQIFSLIGVSDSSVYMTIHPTKFALQKGYLRYEDMQIDIGDNPVNFKGVIRLDKTMDMKVTLPYTSAGKTIRIGKETEGKRITLPLRGTLDKPELDLDKLLEDQLKQQLEERLIEELGGLFKK